MPKFASFTGFAGVSLSAKIILPYFLECFSPSNCIRPLIVYAQQSGLNVYCVCPRIVFAVFKTLRTHDSDT